jgi:hypothetical protein
VSLDLTRVAAQIWGMVAGLKAGNEERRERLGYALGVLRDSSIDLDQLRQRIEDSQRKTTWLVAGLVDGLDSCYKPPPLPQEFTVIATDGSHIDVDRHRTPPCYLINIGAVVLGYGAQPGAALDSFPQLYFEDEELVITSEKGRGQPVEGALLGIKRSVEEAKALASLAQELPPNRAKLALLDGSLIRWNLEAYPEFVTEVLLDKGFIPSLDKIRELKIALASYISFPRSTDVVNALRVAICPYEAPDCDRYCPGKEKSCDKVAGVQDRELFMELLGEGERSALFTSQSEITKRYGEHRVYFFYVRLDDEIARLEIPQWVAEDEALLNLTHSLVLDQCRRGHGYPVALSEAHEKAVITAADREEFWRVVESLMVEEKMPTPTSAKSFSKRTRWV